MTDFLQIAAVLLTTAGAVAVVANRKVTNLAIVLGFYGPAVLMLFVVYQMPGVALSQLASAPCRLRCLCCWPLHAFGGSTKSGMTKSARGLH